MLVAEELPLLVQAAALNLDGHRLGGITLDLEMVTIDSHHGGQRLVEVVEHRDDDRLGRLSLKGEVSLLVNLGKLADSARITAENHFDGKIIEVGDVALDLEAVVAARGECGDEQERQQEVMYLFHLEYLGG